jgi:hypothetical protein
MEAGRSPVGPRGLRENLRRRQAPKVLPELDDRGRSMRMKAVMNTDRGNCRGKEFRV